MRKIVLESGSGKLGNQMMQLMTALSMKGRLPGFDVWGYDMAGWGLSRHLTREFPYIPLLVKGKSVPLSLVEALCRVGIVKSVLMSAIRLDYTRFISLDEAKALFVPPPEDDVAGFDESHLLINVRGAEILSGIHPDYGPVPLPYYEALIRETGLKPVFMGQLSDDYYSAMLRKTFPDAIFVQHESPIRDFQRIRNSKNIVLSISTFSWLAGWLSDADRIYMPLLGGWNPSQRPDTDLTPADDSRFVYDLFPIRRWRGTPEQMAELASNNDFQRVTVDRVGAIRRRARIKIIPRRARKTVQLLIFTLLHIVGSVL